MPVVPVEAAEETACLGSSRDRRHHPHRRHCRHGEGADVHPRDPILDAADTGHRYTDAVFGDHHSVQGIAALEPHLVATLEDLAPPWSRMIWAGAPAPVHAPTQPVPRP